MEDYALHKQDLLEGAGIDLDAMSQNKNQSVLVVEDEQDTVFLLKQILRMSGFNVLSAATGSEALKKLPEHSPDLVVLDIMMPDMDGWQTLDYIREISDIPVIVVSALGTKHHIVEGFKKGVDDYIPKPFHNAEFIERTKAVLRRVCKPQEISRLVFPAAGLLLDLDTNEVKYKDQIIYLTPKEFAVLSVLAKHAPAIVSYETISQSVWGEDTEEINKRTKYLVYLLRRKFDRIQKDHNLILNIDRIGYKLRTEAN